MLVRDGDIRVASARGEEGAGWRAGRHCHAKLHGHRLRRCGQAVVPRLPTGRPYCGNVQRLAR
eukprot:1382501-Pleurochrysis_carterae.AAC.1